MKKTSSLLRCVFALSIITVIFSCQKENIQPAVQPSSALAAITSPDGLSVNRLFGNPVKIGSGVARSWISVSASGVPLEIGIQMTRNAAFNIPSNGEETSFLLSLPELAKSVTPFNHIVIDWNANGHPPFFYELPHFDFHFYMMSVSDRLAIPSYATAPAGFDNNPPPGYLPLIYIAPPGGEEAQMGKHWVDATAPELPWNGGATFTKTFIYGSYNGKVNFFEPMITQAYLQSGVSSTTPYPQPTFYEKSTYYPTNYNVYKENGDQLYDVSLGGFVKR